MLLYVILSILETTDGHACISELYLHNEQLISSTAQNLGVRGYVIYDIKPEYLQDVDIPTGIPRTSISNISTNSQSNGGGVEYIYDGQDSTAWGSWYAGSGANGFEDIVGKTVQLGAHGMLAVVKMVLMMLLVMNLF